ncbi:solute carrier family 10 (sodium/bile acid cotransporter), member 7 [Methylobacterium sp. ap11]|uniref:bile acid:sodium symporter family protein n=1 Tax=Methylobacterium sp. ap11 TaxID=1761799 RepID=UPI0008B88AE2|nr:bile acid:sodium symporter family protein [Methylobacterium sp. ap11]SEP14049.1 solute carrier family 10 (sodium/bile acid cotransporter), member 7 [Methylobacterium sp. ap11]
MLSRLRPDNFTLMIVGALILGSVLPVQDRAAEWLSLFANGMIALLFFLHGARIDRQTALAGLVHWRLHLVVFASTFVLFPILGLAAGLLSPTLLTPALAAGVLFLCVLPSTVQSSIAFTSVAGGNVPAAICSASASNILGMFITPLLVAVLLNSQGSHHEFDWAAVGKIMAQLLLPFALGQLLQPRLGPWLTRHKPLTMVVDRGSILLIVYIAFSHAVATGLWSRTPLPALATMLVVDLVLLALVLTITTAASRLLGFSKEDEITIVFCGSKKSLASGVPMANVIFAGQDVGGILLPLMLFHQVQLMACAALARRYAARAQAVLAAEGPDRAGVAPAAAKLAAR